MKCPNCGYKRQKRDDAFVPATECPSCGIVYSKHEGITGSGYPLSSTMVPSPHRLSAVDPESLKKAKERVEKRLRNRIKAPIRDKHHTKTLELARKISGIPPRKREIRKTTLQQKTSEKVSIENQSSKNREIEPLKEEALLLNEAIGVQIHAEQNNKDDQPIPQAPQTDQKPEDLCEEVSPSFCKQAPEIDENIDIKNDVVVETVILESEKQDTAPIHKGIAKEETTGLPSAHICAQSTPNNENAFSIGLKRLFPIVAWIILLTGIIGAILSWTTINDVQAGIRIPVSNNSSALPLGLLLGFAYLATGALGFAFFWVASLISRQLKDIRQLLMAPSVSRLHEGSVPRTQKHDNTSL